MYFYRKEKFFGGKTMKKTTSILLALMMILSTLVSVIPAQAAIDTLEEPIAGYDDYGYYAYFDFENCADHNLNYMRADGSTNADGSLCDPYNFVLDGSGNFSGKGETIADENGNKFYRSTTDGKGDYKVGAVFGMQDSTGKSYILNEALEVSYRFRMGTESTADASARIGLVATRRGTSGGNYYHVQADIYGNVYAYVNGTMKLVYKNADGQTKGGDGKFIDIRFIWFDTTNTYTLYVNNEEVVSAMPLANNYRSTTYVTQIIDDDFAIADRKIVGASGTATKGGGDRSVEVLRFDTTGVSIQWDLDDLKLARYETAQRGAIYYENDFDGDYDGVTQLNSRSNSYIYSTNPTSDVIFVSEESGNKVLNVKSGHYFGLNDVDYQQYTQDNVVIEFSVKGKPTHTEGRKALVRINDTACMNMYKALFVDANGYLYTQDSSNNRIDGFKLDGSEWLDIAVVFLKNRDNDNKFGPFSSSTTKSTYNASYSISYYINGKFVGSESRGFNEWNALSYFSGADKLRTTAGQKWAITDHTDTLDLSGLTLVDDTTNEGHKIYKSADSMTYYDVSFDANGAQTKYSKMVLSGNINGAEENIRFFTDANMDAQLDNIKVYEGTAPESSYESINSVMGGRALNVDFANFVFPSGNVNAATRSSGSKAYGTQYNSNVTTKSLVHKDENGNALTADTAVSSDYGTLTLNKSQWFDFYIPMPEKVNGEYDFTYSFRAIMKNIGLSKDGLTSTNLFAHRFEKDNMGNAAGALMTLTYNCNIYAGNSLFQLYTADGAPARYDNSNWSDFRIDVHYKQNSSQTELSASYYLNDEPLYRADGTPAIDVTDVFSADQRARFGTSNYRYRFTQTGGTHGITLDVKSLTVDMLAKPVYEEVETDVKINDKVSIIDVTLPEYTSATGYTALSLKKTTDNGAYTLPVISVGADNAASIAIAGDYVALLDASGKAIKVDGELPVTIVYDDNTGFARYYVDGAPAYVKIGGELTAAAELSVFDYDFTQLTGVGSAGLVVFAGYADDDTLLTEEDYAIEVTNIASADAAEIIGFQSNSLSDGLRIIAGVDTLLYSAVGFEIETFIGGESQGVKTVTSNKVFGSIVANDKTVTAEEYGHKYLAAAVVTDIPADLEDGSYLMVRSYAEVNGYKHYDNKVKIVITDGGYYFDQNGSIYQNNFNGISALPAEWKLQGASTASAVLTDKGEVEFKNTTNNAAFLILDQFVGSEYVLQYDFTITDHTVNAGAYVGPVFGYINQNTFGNAYTRVDDYTTTGKPQGEIQFKKNGAWEATPTGGAFDVNSLGGVFETGKPYTVSLAYKGEHVAYFVNGNLVAECVLDGKSNRGNVGIITKAATILVDNVIVKTGDYAEDSYFVYSEDFNNISVIPDGWSIIAGNSVSKATITEDGKLRLIEPKGNYMIAAYNTDVGTTSYVLSADITVTDKETDGRYMGLVTNFNSKSTNVTAWIRFNGQGGISGRLNGTSTSLAEFDIADKGLSLGIGKTVNLKAICEGSNLKFYVDGILVSEATIPADYTSNKVGIITSGITMNVDNFTVAKLVESGTDDSYIQSFDTATLPSDWTAKDTNSTNTVSIADYTAMRVSSPGDAVPQAYLNRTLQLDGVDVNDYAVEADITMIDNSNPNGYFGIIVRSTTPTTDGTSIRNGIYCAYRVGGSGGWIQGNNQSGHEYAKAPAVSAFQNGQTYKFKVVCQGNNVKFYVDDVLVADGNNPNNGMAFDKGTIGFSGKRVVFDVENVKVTTLGENPTVLLETEFNEGKSINEDWRIIVSNSTFNVSYTDQKGKLYVNAADNGTLTHAVLSESVFNYDNYTVSADLTMKRVDNYMGLMLNYKSNSHYILTTLRSNGNVVLEAKTSTGWNTIASGNIGKNVVAGDTYKISATVADGMVYYYLDGTKVLEGAIPEGYEEGTVAFGAKNVDVEVDNFTVVPVTTVSEGDVIYTETFDTAPTAPSYWINEEGAQRYGAAPEIGVWANAADLTDTALRAEAMDSALAVIALDKLFELDSFSFEADLTMTEKSTAANVSYYMGPVFGIQEDSKCGLATMKVPDGTWNVEAWNTLSVAQSEQWTSYASGSYDTTAIHTTYRMKVVGADGYVSFYINGALQTKCKIDEKFMDGNFGIAFRSSEIEIDNVRICKGMEIFEVVNPDTPSTRIRVATFNIGDFSTASGSSGDGLANGNGTEATKAEYRAVFEKVGADIWGLQEDSKYFNGSSKESPYDAIYSVVHTEYERNFTGSYNGKAFLAGYDVYDVKPVYYEMRELDQSQATGYSHPWFLTGKVMIDGKEIALATLHFDWSCKEMRAHQIAQVIEYANKHEYAIIIGDVNPDDCIGIPSGGNNHTELSNNSTHEVDNKLFTDAGYEPANCGRFGTFYTIVRNGVPRSQSPCDNIYVSPNIKILNAQAVYESWMNDHAIVVADIEIN